MTDELVVRGQLSQALTGALHRSTQGLRAVPELLSAAIEQRAWEKRVVVETGEVFDGFSSFDEWVCAAPPKGLGASTTIIDGFTKDNKPLQDAVDIARQRPVGNPTFGHQDTTTIPYIIRNSKDPSKESPAGTSSDYALRKLRKDRPDLHERVLAGEMRPHAAMVEAGFRKPSGSVPKNDVPAIERWLRKHLNSDQIEELVNRLTGDQP